MAILLFKLRNVPDDEAEGIRKVLDEHHIAFYETTAGSWGISMPAIWLHDNDHFKEAKSLLNNYQYEHQNKAKSDYAQLRKIGQHRSSLDMIRAQPLKAALLIAATCFVLYVSLVPFLTIFRP